jgi:predicted alpha/beta hydrolase
MCNSAPAGAHATDHCYSLAAMHRSRLVGILIDTPAAQVGTEVDFWSAALGAQSYPAPGEEQYTVLVGAAAGLITVVQAVDDAPRYHVLSGAIPGLFAVIQTVDDGAPRYHLDIETDDLAAEVARLTALGAEPVARWQDAHTLRSPGGHLLCVVPVHSDPETFAASARTWP